MSALNEIMTNIQDFAAYKEILAISVFLSSKKSFSARLSLRIRDRAPGACRKMEALGTTLVLRYTCDIPRAVVATCSPYAEERWQEKWAIISAETCRRSTVATIVVADLFNLSVYQTACLLCRYFCYLVPRVRFESHTR